MLAGKPAQTMFTAALPPLVSCLGLLTPLPNRLEFIAVGLALGALAMALTTWQFSRKIEDAFQSESDQGSIAKETRHLLMSSTLVVLSPIADRWIASLGGAQDTILLNLGIITFGAITTSIGMAFGNTWVSRSFKAGASRREGDYLLLVAISLGLLAAFPALFASLVISPSYSTEALKELRTIILIYAAATPLGFLNQVHTRLFSSTGSSRSLLSFAVVTLFFNLLLDVLLQQVFGVSGIALSTLVVQVFVFYWFERKTSNLATKVLMFSSLMIGFCFVAF